MSTAVVGAGLAGLAAARRLQEQGEDVIVLEARDCIGGRTRSLRDVLLHGEPADLGASFIDIGQDLLLQVCDEFGLEITPRMALFPSDPDGSYTVASAVRSPLILGGRLLDPSESGALADEVRAAVDAFPPSPTETMPAWTARSGISDAARSAVLAQAGFDPVSPPWRVQMEINHPPPIGRLCWMLADGTDSIAHAIAEGLDIKLEQPVRLVTSRRGGVVVETDSEQFTATDVVIAVPVPPTLDIGFDPVLPAWKANALLSTPMSQGGKVIGQYSHGSLVAEHLGSAVMSDGPISLVWPRPVGPEDTVVVLGLMGDNADGVLRSEQRALTELDEIIRLVAGDAPKRVAGVLRDWTAEEFTGGVVSGTRADHGRLISLLAQNVTAIHFAGEHTDLIFATGMEGALRSGLRAADEILQRRRSKASFAAAGH
jgi:monoamine oxidase